MNSVNFEDLALKRHLVALARIIKVFLTDLNTYCSDPDQSHDMVALAGKCKDLSELCQKIAEELLLEAWVKGE